MPPHHLPSVAAYHRFRGLPGPAHPLVSVVRFEDIGALRADEPAGITQDFYAVALKREVNVGMRYGRRAYDFDGGRMVFLAPGQVYGLRGQAGPLTHAGYLLLLHPDFLLGTALAEGIRRYDYFGYDVYEALFLSEREEATVTELMRQIDEELDARLDRHSKPVLVSQISLLLDYADRFYHRQFLTRERESHDVLTRLEALLDAAFAEDAFRQNGPPTVESIAHSLHLSPNYLSGLLRAHTGRSTRDHIGERLIARAKSQLAGTALSVKEIAYGLGYARPQSFNRVFRARVGVSPGRWRRGEG